jgi:hypothetical protein
MKKEKLDKSVTQMAVITFSWQSKEIRVGLRRDQFWNL